jgi:hypothetical protein
MFRNPVGNWGLNAETAIRTVSPNRIHVEAKFPDGRSFSSSSAEEAMDGGNGVRFKHINYSHPDRWEQYTLWVTREELDDILLECEIAAEMCFRYDFRGAAGCAWSGHEAPWKFFCSEVVYECVVSRFLTNRINHKMHPDKLEEVVKVVQEVLDRRKAHVDSP